MRNITRSEESGRIIRCKECVNYNWRFKECNLTMSDASPSATCDMAEGLRVKLDDMAYEPTRAHATDAGLDLRAREGKIVPAKGSTTFATGVHVKLPRGTAGLLVSKSGLNVKHDLTSTGLIDEGYDGEIVVKLTNHGDNDYEVKAGDKISQLVVIPVRYGQVEVVDDLKQDSARGADGFGSTGR